MENNSLFNNNTNQVDVIESFPISSLFSNTWRIFKEKIGPILKLFVIFTSFIFLALFINNYFFKEISDALITNNKQALKLFSLSQILSYFLYIVFAYVFSTCICISIIKIIHDESPVFKAIASIIKKAIPILLTMLLVIILITSFVILMVICGNIALKVKQSGFIFTIVMAAITILLLIIFIRMTFSLSFYILVMIAEEKYYFKAIGRSFKYAKNHLLSIAGCFALTGLIIILLSITLEMIVYFLTISILPAIEIKGSMSLALKLIADFLPGQIFMIIFYVIYEHYKIDLPDDFSLSTKQKIMIMTPLILLLLTFFIMYRFVG